ncbi:MAG: hypothetical protein U0235_12250 [Polyangiaceae bacterium]
MDRPVPRNDLASALAKFCLAVEEHRRTSEGRVRTSTEFLQHFFTYTESGSTDLIFRYLPKEVRGPILASWHIRGLKAALRDSDEKVESVVYDALASTDIDADGFEQGITPETLIQWVPLASWWALWRGGKLSKKALMKAFETAYTLHLFDAKWFLDTIESRGGKLRGTDVIAEGLTKADLTEWVRRIHESGNGSPAGLVSAIGWEKIVTQTPNDVLTAALDAFALKVGLSIASAPSTADFAAEVSRSSPPRASAPPARSTPPAATPSVPPPQSVPPMRSRRPEPALLSEDKVLAVMGDNTSETQPPTDAVDPEQTGVYGEDELDFRSPSRPPPSASDEDGGNSLRDRIDFIRKRLP